MKAIDIIIGAGWIVFWAYWLVMATTAKAGRSRWTQFAAVRVGIILVVLLLIRLRVFKGHEAAAGNPWLLGAGLAIFVPGLALAVWARVYLGRNWACRCLSGPTPSWSRPAPTGGSATPSTAASSSAWSARRWRSAPAG
jgi:hypothetical protein